MSSCEEHSNCIPKAIRKAIRKTIHKVILKNTSAKPRAKLSTNPSTRPSTRSCAALLGLAPLSITYGFIPWPRSEQATSSAGFWEGSADGFVERCIYIFVFAIFEFLENLELFENISMFLEVLANY